MWPRITHEFHTYTWPTTLNCAFYLHPRRTCTHELDTQNKEWFKSDSDKTCKEPWGTHVATD